MPFQRSPSFQTLPWSLLISILLIGFLARLGCAQAEAEERPRSPGNNLPWSGIQDTEIGLSHLVERYVPDFLGVNRGIIGRASDDQQELTNNNPAQGTISLGQTQYFTFSQKSVLGPKSPATSGLPYPLRERHVEDETVAGSDEEVEKRQAAGQVFLSLNVCAQPSSQSGGTATTPGQLEVYVSASSNNQKPTAGNSQAPMVVDGGYGQINISSSDGVYITIQAPPKSSFSGNYEFELTASIDEPFAVYNNASMSGNDTFLAFADSDTNSAILFTSNLTSKNTSGDQVNTWITNPPPFTLFVQNVQNGSLLGLEKSFCALKGLAQIQGSSNIETKMTTAGDDGLVREQLYATGLNASSSYYAVLAVVGNSTASGAGVVNGGGTVFPSVNFSSKSSRSYHSVGSQTVRNR